MVVCQAAIQRIVDGDTLDAVARIWPGTLRECRVRLLARGQTAVDAWEMRGHDKELGQLAHAFVKQELAGCATLLFYMSEEGQEGRNAYLEKRAPEFGQFTRHP